MRLPRPSSRRHRYGIAAGSLAAASLLAFSSLIDGGISATLAQENDTEYTKSTVTAAWPEAFASVISGSARSASSMINSSSDMTYRSTFRWTTQLSQPPIEPTQETTSGWATRNRVWDERYRGTGVAVDDYKDGAPNPLGEQDPSSIALHDGRAVREFTNPGTQVSPRNNRCLVIEESYQNAINRSDCDLGNGFAAAKNTTLAYGFSIGTGLTQFTYLNAAHLTTSVRCSINSAEAGKPAGRIDFGQENSTSPQSLRYSQSDNPRTIWASNPEFAALPYGAPAFPPGPNTLSARWTVQDILGVATFAKVMPVITQSASLPGAQPYALSEIGAYVEVYRRATAFSSIDLHGKMYFVLSRSECGVKRATDPTLPPQASAFPLNGMPGGDSLSVAPSGSYTPRYWPIGSEPIAQRVSLVAARGMEEDTLPASELPPTTTLTSPLENSTASETTTSAPPNPSGEDESTTAGTSTAATTSTTRRTTTVISAVPTVSAAPTNTTTPPATKTVTTTSAAPAVVIPDEPGTLSPTARLEDVGIVTVGGEDFVVVVQGTTVPTDAPQGVAALEIWLGGGDPGDTWATFTSTDPAADGWRWAAINQETGTVVYIR